jgi:mono/diheme cytochrome c family protein
MNRLPTGKLPFVLIAIMIAMVLSSGARAQGNGEKLYNANKCASCHGPDGAANVPAGKALKARDFHSPEVKAEKDSDLEAVITTGKGKMPAYGKQLKPAEIAELVAYSRALGKK